MPKEQGGVNEHDSFAACNGYAKLSNLESPAFRTPLDGLLPGS